MKRSFQDFVKSTTNGKTRLPSAKFYVMLTNIGAYLEQIQKGGV